MDNQTIYARLYRMAQEDNDCWTHLMMYFAGEITELSRADRERLYALGLIDSSGQILPAVRTYLTDSTPS